MKVLMGWDLKVFCVFTLELLLCCRGLALRDSSAELGSSSVESCLNTSNYTCNRSRSCEGIDFGDDRSCLSAAVPWGTRYSHVRCCFRCCLDYWYRRLGLMQIYDHWKNQLREHSVPSSMGVQKHGFPEWDEVIMSHMTPFVWASMRELSSIFDNRKAWSKYKQDIVPSAPPNGFAMFEGNYKHGGGLQDKSSGNWPAVVVVGTDLQLDIGNANKVKQWYVSNPRAASASTVSECFKTPEIRTRTGKKLNIPSWIEKNPACSPEVYYKASTAEEHLLDELVAFPRAAQTTTGWESVLRGYEAKGGNGDDSTRSKLLMCGTAIKLRGERAIILDTIKRNGFPCTGPRFLSFNNYVKEMMTSKFVWSPPGHGWSNHRDFEALLAGSVPVVEFHPSYVELYRDLPVVQLMNWTELTPKFLEDKWRQMQAKRKTYNLNKVYWPYWLHRLTKYMYPTKNKKQRSPTNANETFSAQMNETLTIRSRKDPPPRHNNAIGMLSKVLGGNSPKSRLSNKTETIFDSTIFRSNKQTIKHTKENKFDFPLITLSHEIEIERVEAINWTIYPPKFLKPQKTPLNPNPKMEQVHLSGEPCFKGCVSISQSKREFYVSSVSKEQLHGPGTFSLVIPWCCEWMSWILQQINFRGLLKEIFIYDKCSATGLNAKDQFHIKQDTEQKISDPDCNIPTDAQMKGIIGKNSAEDVEKIKIHWIDMNEPGRSSCMSTDECGPYLAHIVNHFEVLTDGILFMQPDLRHTPTDAVQEIIDWSSIHSIAPVAYVPLGTKQGAGGNPTKCLNSWSKGLFHTDSIGNILRSGSYRNGIFYTSRLVVRQRPLSFWNNLLDIVNHTEMCAPKYKFCTLEPQRGYQIPPQPPGTICRPGVYDCGKSCNVLEHVWGQVLCQPCHNFQKNQDPRYPWNKEAHKHRMPRRHEAMQASPTATIESSVVKKISPGI